MYIQDLPLGNPIFFKYFHQHLGGYLETFPFKLCNYLYSFDVPET